MLSSSIFTTFRQASSFGASSGACNDVIPTPLRGRRQRARYEVLEPPIDKPQRAARGPHPDADGYVGVPDIASSQQVVDLIAETIRSRSPATI